MNKVLAIVGPTATGKTALALQLSKVFGGELISADSRQVYKGMDIGTGKDIPEHASLQLIKVPEANQNLATYILPQTKLWLVDQVFPNEEWSVSHFERFAGALIQHLWKKEVLPILVGGTGMYLKSMTGAYETSSIPQNLPLRKTLQTFGVSHLQAELKKYNPKKLAGMNQSDRQNPRRLIRAIEIAVAQIQSLISKFQTLNADILWVGIQKPWEMLEKDIRVRVLHRLEHGMVEETQKLMKTYSDWSLPAFSSIGYKETRAYLEGKLTKNELVQIWTTKELQYAKRQMVWFKKQTGIRWFTVDNNTPKHVEKYVRDWYDKVHAEN